MREGRNPSFSGFPLCICIPRSVYHRENLDPNPRFNKNKKDNHHLTLYHHRLWIPQRKKDEKTSRRKLTLLVVMKSKILLLLTSLAAAAAYSPLLPSASVVSAVSSIDASSSVTTNLSSRRNILASAAALATSSFWVDTSRAAEDGLIDYKDADYGFKMKVPSDWDASVQALPDRRKIALYIKPNSDQKTLVFFAYTPIRADFTSLGSFGSVDEVS
jgi:hypothetical protein